VNGVLDADVIVVAGQDDEHAAAVLNAVRTAGGQCLRFDLTAFRTAPQRARIGSLEIQIKGQWYRITSRTTVWWFRLGEVSTENLPEDEAQLVLDEAPYLLRGALAGAGVRWVDDPHDIARAESKMWQLATAAAMRVSVPLTTQTNDEGAAAELMAGGPIVAKAVSPGRGIAPLVDELRRDDLAYTSTNPTLLQRRVIASADLRIVTVSGSAWAWRRERRPTTIDWRAEDPSGAGFALIEAPAACRLAVRITAALGLTMSVQDWLETGAGPVFLEANPQGSWFFLPEAAGIVTPVLAEHLLAGLDTGGSWPGALRRFRYDFLRKAKAPENDGVVAPVFATPSWVHDVGARPQALETARAARTTAEEAAKTAEAKANRLVQTSLALLTLGLTLGAYQLRVALDRSWPWLLSLVPVGAGLIFLALSAFEAVEVDRVGFYRQPNAADLAGIGSRDPAVVLLAVEEEGRRLARWTAGHKLTDLMQARAWFSRGLAGLLLAGIVAGGSNAAHQTTAGKRSTATTTTISSAPAQRPAPSTAPVPTMPASTTHP
jgi:glutathione synthase/RimK-type ligase-like ATP-grasp enzyme